MLESTQGRFLHPKDKGLSAFRSGRQSHDCDTRCEDQQVFNEAASGLTDARDGLLATRQREVGKRYGSRNCKRCTSLLATARRQGRTGNSGAHHASQQAQEDSAVWRTLHLVPEKLSDTHGQGAELDERPVQKRQFSWRTAARKSCRCEGGHRCHGSSAGDGTDERGEEQAASFHLG